MKKIFTLILSVLSLCACEGESSDGGASIDGTIVAVTIDNIDDLTTISEFLVVCSNGESKVVSASSSALNYVVQEGTYDFYVFNNTSYEFEFNTDGDLIASMPQSSGGFTASADTLYCGSVKNVTVGSSTQKVNVTLSQLTGAATLSSLTFSTVGSTTAIKSQSGTMIGGITQWNCTDGVAYGETTSFTTLLKFASSSSLSDVYSLFGTSGDEQYYYYEFNGSSALADTVDVSTSFASFATDLSATFSISQVDAPTDSELNDSSLVDRVDGDTVNETLY